VLQACSVAALAGAAKPRAAPWRERWTGSKMSYTGWDGMAGYASRLDDRTLYIRPVRSSTMMTINSTPTMPEGP